MYLRYLNIPKGHSVWWKVSFERGAGSQHYLTSYQIDVLAKSKDITKQNIFNKTPLILDIGLFF